jgi:CopG family nickel-responsive transcriptional regulator
MTDELVRFGVAMDRTLLEELDVLVEHRGGTRSEVLRDLVRAEVMRSRVERSVPAVGTLTLVYDHHVRELTERLTEFQHKLGERVRATLHIHLDADRCLEVIVLKGRSDELKDVGARLLATRGVTHGNLEIVAEDGTSRPTHGHTHGHERHTDARRRRRKA